MAVVDAAERVATGGGRRERDVGALRGCGDGHERGVVESRHDVFAAVLHRGAVGGGDRRALSAADADAEDGDAAFSGLRGLGGGLSGEVFAIGDEDDRVVVGAELAEGLERGVDRRADVRLAVRRGVDADAGERLVEEGQIGGEGAEEDGPAAEGHDAGAVALELRDQVREIGLGAFEAIRADVGREHGARDVEEDEHVAPAAQNDFVAQTPARACRGDDEQQQRGGAKAELEVERSLGRLLRGIP